MSPQTKQSLFIGIAVVALGSAVTLLLTRGGSDEARLPTQTTLQAVDLASGEELTLDVEVVDAPPYLNPKTGSATVFPWYYCANCNQKFVPNLGKSPDGKPFLPMIKTCPVCGESGAPWSPSNEAEANPKGNAPLPQLPT